MQALVLGTAQWGNPYGVTNAAGRLTDSAIAAIAEFALESGIRHVDTAGSYADAESRLAPWAQRFALTSKVKGSDLASIGEQLATSLSNLGVDRLRCCLVHDWPSLTDARATEVAAELRELKNQGLVQLVGVSVYDQDDLLRAQSLFTGLDAVQLPVSVLDQRLVDSAVVAQLVDSGVEIQARSVLLQGLLLSRAGTVLGEHPDVRRFHDLCSSIGQEPAVVALGFIKTLSWVSQVVLGVTSSQELSQLTEAWRQPLAFQSEGFAGSSDLALIDPRMWSR